jgi:hypothetical protein
VPLQLGGEAGGHGTGCLLAAVFVPGTFSIPAAKHLP